MPSVMKTLLLNPPSFEKFDGGAGSRWPATREIESYWYPVWLSYAAGMLPGSRLLDGPPEHKTPADVVRIALDYEFVVLFTSTVGFYSDLKMARSMKEQKPDLKIAFVGPHVQIKPAESLLSSPDLDFVVRGEFDHAVVEYAQGKPLSEIQNASYVKDGKIVLNVSFSATQMLKLGNDVVSFEGRFGGVGFAVQVPVRAILGIYARETGQGMIFPEGDADPDPTDGPPAVPASGKDGESKKKRPKLQVVK